MPYRGRRQYQVTTHPTPLPGGCAFQFDTFQIENPQAFQGCPQSYDSSPWSSPSWKRKARWAAVALAASGCFGPPTDIRAEEVTADKWYRELSEPVRLKKGISAKQQQVLAYHSNPEVDIAWFGPLSEPSVKVKRSLKPASHQVIASDVPFVEQTDLEPKWHQGWSEPSVKTKRGLRAPLQQTVADIPYILYETVTPDKWFVEWQGPVRHKIGLLASQQSFDASVAFNELTDEEPKWHQAWSEPSVKAKRGLRAALQQTAADVPFVEQTDLEPKWHQGWPDFARSKTQPRAEYHQELAWGIFTPSYEDITPDKWYVSWQDPVRQKPGLSVAQQQFYAYPPFNELTDEEPKWHQGWPDFARSRTQPRAEYQQDLIWSGFTPEVTDVESEWHQPWSEPPVKAKKGLRVSLHQHLADVPFIEDGGIEAKWHYAWSEPVRQKRGLNAARQQFLAQNPSFREEITGDKWFVPWQDPVREKPGLRSSLQQTVAHVPFIEQRDMESKWHQPWSEPKIKSKLGIRASAQPFLSWVPVKSSSLSVALNATETPDVLFGSLKIVYCFHSVVSVVEIKPTYAHTSSPILETAAYAKVSIVEVVLPPNLVATFQIDAFQTEENTAFQWESSENIVIAKVSVFSTC